MPKFLVILTLLVMAAASAQTTPTFLINGKHTVAQVGEKGRIHVDYDVSRLGAAGFKLYLFHHRDELTGEPKKSWHFPVPQGRERITFNDLPIAVYRLWGEAVDAEGKAVANPSKVVHVEYGGWLAWEEFDQSPNADTIKPAPVFSEMPVKTRLDGQGVQVLVSPAAVVLNPSEQIEFKALFQGLPPTDKVRWEMDGKGDLVVTENNTAVYTAPDQLGSALYRVKAFSERHPEIFGGASILVTNQSKADFQRSR